MLPTALDYRGVMYVVQFKSSSITSTVPLSLVQLRHSPFKPSPITSTVPLSLVQLHLQSL